MKTQMADILKGIRDFSILHVYPEEISNMHKFENPHSFGQGEIDLAGDWDRLGYSFLNSRVYKAFKSRLNGDSWESTDFYKHESWRGKLWLKRIPVWDHMLDDIVNNDYNVIPLKPEKVRDEYILILIGRNGHMFIYNGIHRLAACLLSKVKKKIPVKVLLRHTWWNNFRNSIIQWQKDNKLIYSQIPHPDLEHIPHRWSYDRAELIAKYSKRKEGTVLDVGSHWGITSYILSKKGFKPTAVEKAKVHYDKACRIAKFPGASFKVSNKDFTEFSGPIDILLMLNIAHHFIIDKDKRDKFRNFLKNIKPKEVFLQTHKPGDQWSKHITPDKHLSIISDILNKPNITKLETYKGRTLWHMI